MPWNRISLRIWSHVKPTYRYERPRQIYEGDHCYEHSRSRQYYHAPILLLRYTLVSEGESIRKKCGGVIAALLQEHRRSREHLGISSGVPQTRCDLELICLMHTTFGN